MDCRGEADQLLATESMLLAERTQLQQAGTKLFSGVATCSKGRSVDVCKPGLILFDLGVCLHNIL